jgi:hypothetical protein
MSTAKVSVAIGEDELEWARAVARREGKSLSAVLTESLAERRRLAALREVVLWMGKGEEPLSKEELAAATRELGGTALARPGPGRRKASSSRRR